MAIIVEEEKNRVNLMKLLGWLAILGVVAVAIYYIFFAAPELVVIQPPAGFQNIAPISKANIHPEDVLNNTKYTSLKAPPFPLPTPQGPTSLGRQNPFITP